MKTTLVSFFAALLLLVGVWGGNVAADDKPAQELAASGELRKRFDALPPERREKALRLYERMNRLDPEAKGRWMDRLRKNREEGKPLFEDGQKFEHFRQMPPLERARLGIVREMVRSHLNAHPDEAKKLESMPQQERAAALRRHVKGEVARRLGRIYLGLDKDAGEALSPEHLDATMQSLKKEFTRQLKEDVATLDAKARTRLANMSEDDKIRQGRAIATLDLLFASDMTREERAALHRKFLTGADSFFGKLREARKRFRERVGR